MKQLIRLIICISILFLLVACNGAGQTQLNEDFSQLGTWDSGDETEVTGGVQEGAYRMHVKADIGMYWATAGGKDIGDGTYTLEATQLEGVADNGYGMLFRIDRETDSFYVFKISGDGFVWMGRCVNGCAEEYPLVGDGWQATSAIQQGINTTNRLQVVAEGNAFTFYVNDQEVGQAEDDSYASGDVAIMVETLGQGDVIISFDNFVVTPIDNAE